jgi:hypothetical protein
MATKPKAHGGARAGAGRRRSVPLSTFQIGAACEAEQHQHYERLLALQYADRPDIKAIRVEQAKIRTKQYQRGGGIAPAKLAPKSVEKIDAIGRYRRVELSRPLGVRAKVLAKVAADFKISRSTADRYWKRFRVVYAKAKRELDFEP